VETAAGTAMPRPQVVEWQQGKGKRSMKSPNLLGRPAAGSFSLILLLILVPSCGTQPEELQRAYLAAVQDAANPTSADISKNLWAIVPANDKLVWESEPGSSRVLVVTWTSYTGYNDKVGQDIQTTREVWVTAVPEVKEFIHSRHVLPWDLTLRLEELLGVPPNSGKTTFVEFWVSPDDLFRPSPDPEITDQEAGLDFPRSTEYVTVDDAFIQWFNNLKNTSYGEGGYPWTRLGYTYDWGDPFSQVGVSEFVIRTGASVGVYSTANSEEYCRWW
jgi:hypothetical protein